MSRKGQGFLVEIFAMIMIFSIIVIIIALNSMSDEGFIGTFTREFEAHSDQDIIMLLHESTEFVSIITMIEESYVDSRILSDPDDDRCSLCTMPGSDDCKYCYPNTRDCEDCRPYEFGCADCYRLYPYHEYMIKDIIEGGIRHAQYYHHIPKGIILFITASGREHDLLSREGVYSPIALGLNSELFGYRLPGRIGSRINNHIILLGYEDAMMSPQRVLYYSNSDNPREWRIEDKMIAIEDNGE